MVEPAQREWEAPLVIASMKDGSVSFCLDCRKLKGVAKQHVYLVPSMEECIELRGEVEFFFPLDKNR